MRFIILSDSHGHLEKINEVLRRAGRYDEILFLGDGLRDILHSEAQDPCCVKGNCDVFLSGVEDFPATRILDACNKRIIMTHGHKYDVKYSLDKLIYLGAENDADIILFGHTHEPYECRLTPDLCTVLKKPLYLFNPGSIGDYHGSWGCLDITSRGEIMLSFGEL